MQAGRWISRTFETATGRAASLLLAILLLAPSAASLRQTARMGTDPSSSKAAGAPDTSLALKIIASAVAITENCEPVSQGFLLLLAGDAAIQVDRRAAISYYSKSFEVSRLLPRSGTRLGLQLALATRMTRLDPDRALALLEQMDPPDVAPNPNLDVRSGVASPIVAGLLREGPDGAERAASLLDYLGDTGQYPYAAAGQVIDFFHARNEKWRANAVFLDALNHFLNDDRFDNSPDEFVALAEGARDKIESNALLDAVGRVLLLARQQDSLGDQGLEQTGLANGGGNMRVQRHLSRVLGRLLLVASAVDPSAADELNDEYAALTSIEAGRSSQTSPSGLGPNTGTSSGMPKQQVPAQEQRELAVTSPSGASSGGLESSSLADRSLELARTAKRLARHDPSAASSLLHQAEAQALAVDFRSSDAPADRRQLMDLKVEALAETAEGWAALGDERQASRLLTAAFATVLEFLDGQAVVESAIPSGLDSEASLLGRLARLETDLNPQQALRRAASIPDLRLRAFTVLSVAMEVIDRSAETRRTE